MKREKIRKNGFTLIELLAVIIILGILMIIAIPSVTSYINNSRKSAYVDTAKEIISGARNFVNEGKVDMYNTDVTYYIDYACIKTENAQKSPYGDFVSGQTYVIVTYDGKGYNYYWVSRDTTGQGVSVVTSANTLDEDDIESDIAIDAIKTTVGVGTRSKTQVINANCQKEGEETPVTTSVAETGGNSEGNNGGSTPTQTAASTILATAQAAGQLNQIPDTNIYIFKGGTSAPPANYVKFNGENWRIIGIYNGQMKIIRVNSSGVPTAPTGFTSIKWNTTTPNPGWANSSLKESLNTTYYNTLSDTAKAMIDENGSWDVGPAASNATASGAYTSATTNNQTVGSTTHTTPWTGKVGLMASYEYLYASGLGGTCLTTVTGGYFDGYNNNPKCGTAANDWLLNTGSSLWTVSPSCVNANYALDVLSSGLVGINYVDGNSAAAPAVFLKSSVRVASGDGTNPANAYILQ